jgi:hypothetical protein
MLKLLLRNPNKNVLLAPYLRGHLQRADIEKSVAQMVDNSRIRLFSQECFIRVDRISRQQTLPSFWYVFLYVFEELGRGLLWRDFWCEDFNCKTTFAVCFGTPFSLSLWSALRVWTRKWKFLPSCPLSPSTDESLLPTPPYPVIPSRHWWWSKRFLW